MSRTLACPRCHKVGFVRVETVIKGGRAIKALYCGACGHKWQEVQDPGAQSDQPDDAPDDSA